jgi:hypothetical protein
MIRSVVSSIGLGLLILGAYACGGDKPPPATPDNTASTSDAGADMPSTDTAKGDGGATTASTGDTPTTPPPAPAKLDLPAASAKFKLKGKDIEIKSDGTVNTGGKPTHKIAGMELQDKDAKSLLKVGDDGTVTMSADGSPYGKFDGDDMTGNDGSKLSAGDDGISQTDAKGKKTALAAKAEGIGTAKKATLLVVSYNLWGAKPPKPAAPKGDKPAGDKGKPAGKK